jgi:hypothetical protein
MSAGGLLGVTNPSAPVFNKKTVFIGTGAEIAAVPLTNPATVFVSTTTESGYTENTMYITKADLSGRVAVARAHNHSSASDTDGGDIYDVWVANAGQKMAVGPRFTRPGNFGHIAIQSGAAPSSTHIDTFLGTNVLHTRLKTTTTNNFWTQVYDGGLALSWANKVEWRIKMSVKMAAVPTDNLSNFLWRAGVNMETVDVAGNGTENRMGMEGCSSDPSANLRYICANTGGTRTNADGGVTPKDIRGYQMQYTPGTNIIAKDSSGNITSITSNVPASGSIASDRELRYGIKTTAAAEKIMYIVADALFYTIEDALWVT